MNRVPGWTLLIVTSLLVVAAVAAWMIPAPLDPWRTMMLEPGGALQLGPDVPDDPGLLAGELLVQTARRSPLVVALVMGLSGAISVWLPPPRRLRWFMLFAPVLVGSFAGAFAIAVRAPLYMAAWLCVSTMVLAPLSAVVMLGLSRWLRPHSTFGGGQ